MIGFYKHFVPQLNLFLYGNLTTRKPRKWGASLHWL